jgi:hypothetical protein
MFVACAALRDDMRRTETAFDEARYEDVQAWLAELEPQVPDMRKPMRVRFYYLRGVTAFRLGDKVRARHYLALCREEGLPNGEGLRDDWRPILDSTLRELDVLPLDGKT